MGRFGHYVIDADGHGGEPLDWRRRIPDAYRSRMHEYVASMKATYTGLPGGGNRVESKPANAHMSSESSLPSLSTVLTTP